MTSDGTASVRCGFQLASEPGSLPPTFFFFCFPHVRQRQKESPAWKGLGLLGTNAQCKNRTNWSWLVFIKFEVVLLSATPTSSALKPAQRRQLHTINTAQAGFVVTAIKASSGGNRSGTTCVYLCMRQGYMRLLSSEFFMITVFYSLMGERGGNVPLSDATRDVLEPQSARCHWGWADTKNHHKKDTDYRFLYVFAILFWSYLNLSQDPTRTTKRFRPFIQPSFNCHYHLCRSHPAELLSGEFMTNYQVVDSSFPLQFNSFWVRMRR